MINHLRKASGKVFKKCWSLSDQAAKGGKAFYIVHYRMEKTTEEFGPKIKIDEAETTACKIRF